MRQLDGGGRISKCNTSYQKIIMSKNFSQRIGAEQSRVSLQVDEINEELKNSLWNILLDLYNSNTKDYWKVVVKGVATNFRKFPADELPYRNYDCRDWLKEYFFSLNWYETYNLIEFLADNHRVLTRISYGHGYTYHKTKSDELKTHFNSIFERELSGFRFISGVLSPISDKVEQTAIEDTINAAREANLFGAQEHLETSLKLLGKKPEPDYRNSIKEAISAVESVAKKISGSHSNGLSGAIEELSQQTDLHRALKAGFNSLYGYSSDTDGVRHAILDQPSIGFVEAKYMLVSCSAFVHYLIEKADQASLLDQ